jgi:hypothetical protein
MNLFQEYDRHCCSPSTVVHEVSLPTTTLPTMPPCHSDTYGSPWMNTVTDKYMVQLEKQRRRKRDRMIFNFWIPLFLVMIALVIFKMVSVHVQVSHFWEYLWPSFLIRL